MSNTLVLEHIDTGVTLGFFSYLNRAFARFLVDIDATADGVVIMAGALVSRHLDRGEVYLDLQALCAQTARTLGLSESAGSPALALLAPIGFKLEDWLNALRQSPLVACGEGDTPLVLDGHYLYFRRYWCYQQTLASGIRARLVPIRDSLPAIVTDPIPLLFSSRHEQPDWQKIACVLALRARFSIITGGPGTGKTTTLTKLLALLITQHEYQETQETPRKLNIFLAAPTGKAAARVSESISKAVEQLDLDPLVRAAIPTQAFTLHRLLGSRHDTRQFKYHRYNPLVADIVIVDEASMIDLEMMACLLDALPDSASLILLGDKDQLASVEAGSVMGDLCQGADLAGYNSATLAWIKAYAQENVPTPAVCGSAINQQTIMLRYSHRFNNQSGIGQLARAVNRGDRALAQALLNDTQQYPDLIPKPAQAYFKHRKQPHPDSANQLLKSLVLENAGLNAQNLPHPGQGYGLYRDLIENNRPADASLMDAWAKQVMMAFDTFQVLCAVREGDWGVEGLNPRIADWLLPQKAVGQWYEGRAVMIRRNDYLLNLMNGDIGITLKDSLGKLKVVFPADDVLSGGKLRWISPTRLPDVETAFAMTVHKSQGSEFNHVVLILPEHNSLVITRELIYTGITRSKEQFTLLETQAGIFGQGVLSRCK